MFVYHGIVDQTNPRGGLEFVFAILPTVVKIGASFIILRYRTTNKDESNPTEGAEDYFGAEIEAATIAEDEKTATFTSGNVTLQLPRDMKAMRVEIQYEAPIPAITSSMTCIMEHSLINVEPLHRELALFLGPVEIDGQFQGNLVALVLSKKGSSGASTPVRICMAWNSKTATGENVSNPAEPPDGSNDKDLSPHFIMCNEGHDFKATLSQRGDTLEISLRGRYMNDALSSWAVVAIPLLEKPRTTLQNILAGVIPDYTMTVTNTAEVSGTKREEHAVMCTITKETDTDLDEFLTRAGLFLAVVGLAAGLPAFPSTLGMGIAIAGLPLAIKPYIEMEYKTSTEASKLLYPGDSVQLACTGWTSRNDFKIDLVLQNVSSESGRTQILTTRYTTRQFVTDKDKNKTAYTGPIIHNNAATETHISSIFFEAPLQLIQRRLLIVEGLTTVSAEQNTSFPLSLEEGAVIEYPDKQTLEATNASKWFSGTYHPSSYWSQRRDSEHPLFYSDPNRSVAVVQWETKLPDANPHDSIGQVRFFPGPPFTPVLALQDMWIFQTSGTNRTWVSADETWDDTLASIQKFESDPKNKAFKFWGYIHDQNHYLWACPFPPDNSSWKVQQSPRCWVYFPIRHWVPTAVLAQN